MLDGILRPGGLSSRCFIRSRKAFSAILVDSNTLQVIGAAPLGPAQRVYQNREIQDLFGRFRTVKSFVGRDQLRESLFVK